MRFNVTTNLRDALGELNDLEARQLPFAVMLGLNRLANDVQDGIRQQMKEAFELRRESWNLNSIKILKPDRATKSTWRVVISLDPRAGYFEKFEEGGAKIPMLGRHFLWIPEEKTFKRKIIRASDPLRPANLHMHLDSGGRIIGEQRTFMVRTSKGPMVVQRQEKTHPGFTKRSIRGVNLQNFGNTKRGQLQKRKRAVKPQSRVLYHLRSTVKIAADLKFEATAQQVVDLKAVSRFREAMDFARTPRR